jgi:hypothetical protein
LGFDYRYDALKDTAVTALIGALLRAIAIVVEHILAGARFDLSARYPHTGDYAPKCRQMCLVS